MGLRFQVLDFTLSNLFRSTLIDRRSATFSVWAQCSWTFLKLSLWKVLCSRYSLEKTSRTARALYHCRFYEINYCTAGKYEDESVNKAQHLCKEHSTKNVSFNRSNHSLLLSKRCNKLALDNKAENNSSTLAAEDKRFFLLTLPERPLRTEANVCFI